MPYPMNYMNDKNTHSHGSADNNHHGSVNNIASAFFLNLFFTLFEIAGALFTNSVAILSDAVHDLGDTLTLGLSWWFEKI